MKRLLLPLLAVFALPTAINAESTYLTCDLVDDSDRRKKVDITLNESQGKVTYMYPSTGSTWTVNGSFTKKSILFSTKSGGSSGMNWEVDRTNGNIYSEYVLFDGTIMSTAEGKCKKAEETKTLF